MGASLSKNSLNEEQLAESLSRHYKRQEGSTKSPRNFDIKDNLMKRMSTKMINIKKIQAKMLENKTVSRNSANDLPQLLSFGQNIEQKTEQSIEQSADKLASPGWFKVMPTDIMPSINIEPPPAKKQVINREFLLKKKEEFALKAKKKEEERILQNDKIQKQFISKFQQFEESSASSISDSDTEQVQKQKIKTRRMSSTQQLQSQANLFLQQNNLLGQEYNTNVIITEHDGDDSPSARYINRSIEVSNAVLISVIEDDNFDRNDEELQEGHLTTSFTPTGVYCQALEQTLFTDEGKEENADANEIINNFPGVYDDMPSIIQQSPESEPLQAESPQIQQKKWTFNSSKYNKPNGSPSMQITNILNELDLSGLDASPPYRLNNLQAAQSSAQLSTTHSNKFLPNLNSYRSQLINPSQDTHDKQQAEAYTPLSIAQSQAKLFSQTQKTLSVTQFKTLSSQKKKVVHIVLGLSGSEDEEEEDIFKQAKLTRHSRQSSNQGGPTKVNQASQGNLRSQANLNLQYYEPYQEVKTLQYVPTRVKNQSIVRKDLFKNQFNFNQMENCESPKYRANTLLNLKNIKAKKVTEKPNKLLPYQIAEQTRVYERDPYVGRKSEHILGLKPYKARKPAHLQDLHHSRGLW